jgi:hypothetical protein
VALVVQVRVLVDLCDDDPVVAEMLRKPLGRDEGGLRIAVSSHRVSS